jgi:hypothetical protein
MFIQSRNQQYKINHPKSAIPHFTPKIISKLCQTRNKMFNIQHMFSLSISHSKICKIQKFLIHLHPKLKYQSHIINDFRNSKSCNSYKIYNNYIKFYANSKGQDSYKILKSIINTSICFPFIYNFFYFVIKK